MPKRHIISAIYFTTDAVMPKRSGFGNSPRNSIRDFPMVWRNLGIGYFNIRKDDRPRPAAYDRAFRVKSSRRAAALRARPALETARRKTGEAVARTGKTSATGCAARRSERRNVRALQPNRPARESAAALPTRKFQPWEGGEGGRSANRSAPIWRWDARR